MPSKKILAAAFLALYCTAALSNETPTTDPKAAGQEKQESRIRMFGQNGASAVLFRDSACAKGFWSKDGEKASGSFSSAFGSFVGKVSNTSLGIAETETTRHLSEKDGLLSKAYFREYAIPANKPTTLSMRFQDISTFYRPPKPPGVIIYSYSYSYTPPRCGGSITFTPEAGQDYEVGFTWDKNSCLLSVNHVVTKEGQTELVPVSVADAPDCPAQ